MCKVVARPQPCGPPARSRSARPAHRPDPDADVAIAPPRRFSRPWR